MVYDFGGYATRNDLRCSDGRTIRKDAFRDCDGMTVPLVYQHEHGNVGAVLGHALLENRDDGVYCYCAFNDTDSGKNAKELVRHGDIKSLSIYANKLVEKAGNVVHGMIREVSLVLAGANPGAFIDTLSISHSDFDDAMEEEALIYPDFNDELEELSHADDEEESKGGSEETIQDVIDSMSEIQKKVLYFLVGKAKEGGSKEVEHSDDDDNSLEHEDSDGESDDETVEDVVDTMSDKQKKVMYFLIGKAMENKNTKGEKDMAVAHNAFEDQNDYVAVDNKDELTHSEMETIIKDGKRMGSLKESFLAHAADYGIDQIDWLFPEPKTTSDRPEFISRRMEWVSTVMNGVSRSPFSRIKSMFADIREDEARAKGYIKGHLKKDEVFSLLKRSTTPTTIYKKQKLDRDDIIDITDFDVVAWIKGEMRIMLDEEIARAILVGDGRLASDDDHINEENVRPIWKEEDLFCIKTEVTVGSTDDETAKNFIRTCIKSRKDYRGSGNPTLFTTEDMLTDLLLLEDSIGHKLYKTEAELATALRVSKIVTVPVMENLTRAVTKSGQAYTNTLKGIIVNLNDYKVGADKGGSINMFEDFDIDYNQEKYLIETRISGCLVKPFSAIVLETSTQG